MIDVIFTGRQRLPIPAKKAPELNGRRSVLQETSRRKYERVRIAGSVRMMIDGPEGLRMGTGQLVDLCEGGCAISTKTPIEEHVAGRVQVEIDGKVLWLPIVTHWVRCGGRGWIFGCSFDRPTKEKQRAIRSLLWDRRNLGKT